MNAVLPFVMGSLGAERSAAAPAVFEPAVTEYFLPEDEMGGLLKEFAKHGEKLDRLLTEAEEIQNFEYFFSAIQSALMSVGTFGEGDGDEEVDFASSRNMDPSRVLRVKTLAPVTLETARTVLAACVALGSEHAVVFYGKEERSVLFSNGDWCREE